MKIPIQYYDNNNEHKLYHEKKKNKNIIINQNSWDRQVWYCGFVTIKSTESNQKKNNSLREKGKSTKKPIKIIKIKSKVTNSSELTL